VLGRRDLRVLAGLGWLCVFYVVPEGLAVPYAAGLGVGSAGAGLMLAAIPCGATLGAIVFSRFLDPQRRLALMGPLAFATCAPLIGFVVHPGVATGVLLLALSGAASAYMLAANAAFVAAVPPASRGTAFGLVQAVMSVGQGVAIVLAGLAAARWEPAGVIAAAGGAGCIAAVLLGWSWQRAESPVATSHVAAAAPAESSQG
jgi:predicted MFS family arabinose efflux permease